MKKIILAIALSVITIFSFAQKGVHVVSGDPGIIAQKGVFISAEFDYSEITVDGLSLSRYFKTDDDAEENWNEAIKDAEKSFVEEFNDESKKTFRMLLADDEEVDYYVKVHVLEYQPSKKGVAGKILTGGAGGGGGDVMSGTIDIEDGKTREVLCTLEFNGIKGSTAYKFTQSAYMSSTYGDLGTELGEIAVKAAKAKK
ncbi:MAG: hypothetical protein IJ202_06335 [Bacteroidales bacterium]|nr:hypothetical protein [Bacteroidales bacterium]